MWGWGHILSSWSPVCGFCPSFHLWHIVLTACSGMFRPVHTWCTRSVAFLILMRPEIRNGSVCVVVALGITEKTEQRVCIQFCQSVEKVALKQTIWLNGFRRVFQERYSSVEWLLWFKEARTTVESDARFEARQKCCSQIFSVKTVLCITSSLQRVTQ